VLAGFRARTAATSKCEVEGAVPVRLVVDGDGGAAANVPCGKALREELT